MFRVVSDGTMNSAFDLAVKILLKSRDLIVFFEISTSCLTFSLGRIWGSNLFEVISPSLSIGAV